MPTRRGEHLYYTRTEEGKQYPIQCRRKGSMEAPEEVLLDANELAKTHKFVGVGAFAVSDDQNLLAYTVDFTGFRQYTLQVKDLRTGSVLPDNTERVTSVEWAADNKTLFLTTEDAITKTLRQTVAACAGYADIRAGRRRKDRACTIVDLGKTRDKQYLVLNIESKDTTEARHLRAAQPSGTFAVFLPREKKHRYYVDHREGTFYIKTNKPGKNFAIVTAAESDLSPKNWKTFVAHRDDVLVQDIDLFRDFAVVVEKAEGLNRLRVYQFAGRKWSPIAFPEPVYSAFPVLTPDYDSKTYRYNYQSFVTPSSVYDYDAASGQSAMRKRQPVLGGWRSLNSTLPSVCGPRRAMA